MVGVYKKPYDEEFKKNAVEMWVKGSKPLSVLARELGVCADSLRKWRDKELGKQKTESQQTGDGLSVKELAEENRALREELARVTRQRDIIKKAMGILSETSPGGMP
jgi:transposase